LLHLVGYLYYWQMGFNSVFKGLNKKYMYSYLKCIVYDKLLKPRQSF
jgi:hypothetical protein